MGFKEDADFARFLTMGAHGTAAIRSDLEARGHQVIELERYAMANKVWSVKVKRLRIPDLLCVRCGRRIESRAKSKLAIKLSDSSTPGREWSAGGMRDDDLFGFVRVVFDKGAPVIGRPCYVTTASLAAVVTHVKGGNRKARSEGMEADITWPSWVPSYPGIFLGRDEAGALLVETVDGKTRKYANLLKWPEAHVYLQVGESFGAADTVVAAMPRGSNVTCTGDTWDWHADLEADDRADRYAAVKSSRRRGAADVSDVLAVLALDVEQDWRLRLEAAASLSAADPERWIPELGGFARDTDLPTEQQIEAVFILSELSADGATEALVEVATEASGRHEEVRAAAVWGLGTGAAPAPEHVVQFAADPNDRVALHAGGALELVPSVLAQLVGWMDRGGHREAAVAATLLARDRRVAELLQLAGDADASGRLFALRALGDLPEELVREEAGSDMPDDLDRLLAAIWVQHDDWTRTAENDGAFDVLQAQRVRF